MNIIFYFILIFMIYYYQKKKFEEKIIENLEKLKKNMFFNKIEKYYIKYCLHFIFVK